MKCTIYTVCEMWDVYDHNIICAWFERVEWAGRETVCLLDFTSQLITWDFCPWFRTLVYTSVWTVYSSQVHTEHSAVVRCEWLNERSILCRAVSVWVCICIACTARGNCMEFICLLYSIVTNGSTNEP